MVRLDGELPANSENVQLEPFWVRTGGVKDVFFGKVSFFCVFSSLASRVIEILDFSFFH